MRRIEIFGIGLRDCSLRESMRLVDAYLKEGAVHTIDCVTAQMLLQAETSEEQKEWLEAMDMTVLCDADVLRAARAETRGRVKEIENQAFLKEFFKKLAREKRNVYLLGDRQDALDTLKNYLTGRMITVSGETLLTEEAVGRVDSLINEINDVAPDVILVTIPYPAGEQFVFENKGRINSSIWMGLPGRKEFEERKETWYYGVFRRLRGRFFRHKVDRYKNEERAE